LQACHPLEASFQPGKREQAPALHTGDFDATLPGAVPPSKGAFVAFALWIASAMPALPHHNRL
jgi:hypothetical protein